MAFYKKKFVQLAKKVIKNGKKGRGPAKKKFNDYSKHHQKRIKNLLKEECQSTLSFLGLYNFIATKIKVLNTDTNQYETFNLVGEGELTLTESDPKELTNDDLDNINMWLYLKDKFNISNETWHEISMKANGVPNAYSINKRINEINSKWALRPTPGDAEGVQLGFAESLREHIVRLQQNGEIKDGETIKIKLSGDGTNIGKRLTVVNFTFTIPNEKEVAMGEKGNYILAVIKTAETYDNLRDSLADLRMEMSNLQEISAHNCTYKLEYFLGGDWKFLALICGLGRANEDYACVWCKCPRQQRWDTSKKWSINDPTFGARTIEEIAKFSKGKKFNCKAKPLFDFIPMDHVIIDTLHLFLRISDVLIDLLIRELGRSDAIAKKKTRSLMDSLEISINTWQVMKNLSKVLESLNYRINKESKKLEYRDLTGPEKLKLFQNINIPMLLPQCSQNKDIQVIWTKFMDIIGDLKLDFTSEDSILELQGAIKARF